MIDKYFKEYVNKYYKMKKALKRYIDSKLDFYNLTGINYDDMPKAKGKSLGFDDLMGNIEELFNKYLALNEEYEVEREKCQLDIDELKNPIHKFIIEYAYLDFENDKKILKSLKEFNNLEYSYSHMRRLKSQAIKEFEKMIQNDTK